MPLITIKMFKEKLSEPQAAELIQKVMEAVIPFIGERLRKSTWVLIEEVQSGYWGVGGKAFGLKDIPATQPRE